MNTNEQIKVTGALSIVKTNEYGEVTDSRYIPNLVVTVGKTHIMSRLTANTDTVMTHMGVGAGLVAPDPTNTSLGSVLGARQSLVSVTAVSNVVTYVASFIAGVATGAIAEAGIFNALTGGIMLCRTQFPVVTKAAGDSIVITWVVTLS